jgi:predicted flap endonuclease-1-like 5' DNA nuclease
MIPFWAETALLMGAAYFLGAVLACVIRRGLAPAVRPAVVSAERRVDPLPEVAQADARGARFARTPEPAARAPAPPPPEPARPAAAPSPRPAAAVAAGPQDLRSIQGIDAGTEAALKGLGVTRYEAIAAWTGADVARIGQALGEKGRIARENWVEQAQVLAKGGQTLFSMRRARGEASTAAPTPDEGVPAAMPAPSDVALPRPMSRVGVSAVVIAPPPPEAPRAAVAAPPLVSDRAAFARQPAGTAAPAVPIRPAEPPAHDNLQRIGVITAETEKRLNALGVARYSEIAQWSPAAVERIDKDLGLAGRISRENWIEQAQILSRGGDTRFSREFDRHGPTPAQSPSGPPPRPIKLPDAIREHVAAVASGQAAPLRADLGSLRSVRSQAYQDTTEPGPEAARRAASRKVVRGALQPDDLKRIRGIGVMIEKKLNSLGVASYEDIANWTSEDIERISEQLDFKGRIQRENWVEQARILAAGGDTEFSRRTDRSRT